MLWYERLTLYIPVGTPALLQQRTMLQPGASHGFRPRALYHASKGYRIDGFWCQSNVRDLRPVAHPYHISCDTGNSVNIPRMHLTLLISTCNNTKRIK